MTNQNTPDPSTELLDEIDNRRRAVDTETYDIIIRQIISMIETDNIDIAPEYQRRFKWDAERQSRLIESIFLGIPLPNVFVAENRDGTLEVVDGVQRLSTVAHFVGSPEVLKKIDRSEPLKIEGLEILSKLNGLKYSDLPPSLQNRFLNRSIRFTSLNDKSNLSVRFDLFERLNTGGIRLHEQEIRNCIYLGPFRSDLEGVGRQTTFRKVVKLANEASAAEYEELVLRFFALLDGYQTFKNSVKGFLNDYMERRRERSITQQERDLFTAAMDYLASEFPAQLTTRSGRTPVNLFEGLAVGAAMVINAGKKPKAGAAVKLRDSADYRKTWGAGSNARKLVKDRIEQARDAMT